MTCRDLLQGVLTSFFEHFKIAGGTSRTEKNSVTAGCENQTAERPHGHVRWVKGTCVCKVKDAGGETPCDRTEPVTSRSANVTKIRQ